MPGLKGNRPSKAAAELHRLRTDPLYQLKAEQEALQNTQNGVGEANVVLTAQLGPLLREWKQKWEKENELAVGGQSFDYTEIMGPMEWLRAETKKTDPMGEGLNVRRISAVMREEYRTIGLKQAEWLLMAIDREYILSSGELLVIPNPAWSFQKWFDYMKRQGAISSLSI